MENFQKNNRKAWTEVDDFSAFPSLMIGNSLTQLKANRIVETILNNISHFTKMNMSKFGAWQHFTPEHELYTIEPFDIDSTSCSSLLLERLKVKYPDNKSFFYLNRNDKGLFYTWFILRKLLDKNLVSWHSDLKALRQPVKSYMFWKYFECDRNDIDAVVNANVLFYLGENEQTRPIINLLIETIDKKNEDDCDKWYRNVQTVYYFFSKNYFCGIKSLEAIREKIKNRILMKIDENGAIENNSMDTSLGICTLLNLNYFDEIPQASIKYLINKQGLAGNWEKRIFYYGGPKKVMGWGGDELSTAICIEALYRYGEIIGTQLFKE